MSDESEGGGGRIPEVPVPVPTPGVPQDEIVWTQWADVAARAAAVSPDDAGILRWAGFRADLGAPTYPDDDPPPGFGQPGPGLRRLAAAGLATRLADGGYWPGRHEAAVAARSAQPVLDALAGFLGAGAADILGDRWFRVEPDALAAAARYAGRSCPTQVFDELVRFLVEDGWLERRGAAHWRFTPRTLAERGPAPGPDSPFPRRRPAPGGLRGLFADADRPGTDAPREAARRAAGDRGLDADHQAVLGILASAAEPDTRLASVPRSDLASTAGVSVHKVRGILRKLAAAGLVERVHPGGMGPKDPSTYIGAVPGAGAPDAPGRLGGKPRRRASRPRRRGAPHAGRPGRPREAPRHGAAARPGPRGRPRPHDGRRRPGAPWQGRSRAGRPPRRPGKVRRHEDRTPRTGSRGGRLIRVAAGSAAESFSQRNVRTASFGVSRVRWQRNDSVGTGSSAALLRRPPPCALPP